jgi:hypothetical protein
MMGHFGMLTLALAMAALLSACQTSQSRKDQLATICADPINRQSGSFYFDECQSLYPSTDRQLQRNYRTNAPGV